MRYPKNKTVCIRINDKTFTELEGIANQKQSSVSAVIRELCLFFLKQKSSRIQRNTAKRGAEVLHADEY